MGEGCVGGQFCMNHSINLGDARQAFFLVAGMLASRLLEAEADWSRACKWYRNDFFCYGKGRITGTLEFYWNRECYFS